MIMRFLLLWFMRISWWTPYFHLDGYMHRWWVFGADNLIRNQDNPNFGYVASQRARKRSRFYQWLTERIAIRLHHILRSDTDRHPHDHPAWSVSLILIGGYWELIPAQPNFSKVQFDASGNEPMVWKWRAPGSIVIRRATDRHRLVLPVGQTAWSIFVIGRKWNPWGFYTDKGKIPWREYLKSQEAA